MLTIKMINGSDVSHSKIAPTIKKIRKLNKQYNFTFQHCYREVNHIADYLANKGEQDKSKKKFTQNLTVHVRVKYWLKNDRKGRPTFRIKAHKRQFTLDNGQHLSENIYFYFAFGLQL